MGMTPQHIHTIPTSCAISPLLIYICLLVVCRELRVVEGSGVGSSGCVVHFNVHGVVVVGGCIVVAILSMADMICL